ncbi:MAG: response regulator [Myxococcota bacterium]
MTLERVLCVDDDPQILSGLERSLRKVCPVTTANGGQAALELLRRDRNFAIIISDMRMPVMDGAQFLREARLLAPDAVRVLLTGEADLEAVISAVNAGHIHHYLRKPLERDELTRIVQRGFLEYAETQGRRERARKMVRAGVDLTLLVLSVKAPAAAAHAQRAGQLATRLGEALGLSDLFTVELAAELIVASRHVEADRARALFSDLLPEDDGLGGAQRAVLELWTGTSARNLSVAASVVNAAIIASEVHDELSEVERSQLLEKELDPRVLDALRSIPRAA